MSTKKLPLRTCTCTLLYTFSCTIGPRKRKKVEDSAEETMETSTVTSDGEIGTCMCGRDFTG